MIINRKTIVAAGVSASALFVAAAPALAQTTAPAAAPSDGATQVDEVVVTGIRGALRSAIGVKRRSDLVVEAISSEDIGQLPNVTIAEELVRLPGINGTRDRGNQSQAAIRGLGPRLVLGLVNGREVASSEPDRNIRWEIYPSEIVSGVEVYKSQSADLVSGGIAGTIDIRTTRPLDYRGPGFVGTAGAAYYDAGKDLPDYDPLGYRLSANVNHAVNDTLAVNLGLTRQVQKNGYATFEGWGWNDAATGGSPGDINNDGRPDATFYGAQSQVKRLTETRNGVNGALQWRPSDRFELNFDALYSDIKIDEDQNQIWYGNNGTYGNWGGGSSWAYSDPQASYNLIDGTVVAARLPYASVTNVIAKYTEDKTLFATGLNGKWSLGDWTLVGDLAYSSAKRENLWRAVFTEQYPSLAGVDMTPGRRPSAYAVYDTGNPASQPLQDYRPAQADGGDLSDELTSARFDATRYLGDSGITELSFGARVTDRTKSYDRTFWTQTPIIATLPAGLLTSFTVPDFDTPSFINGDFDAVAKAAIGGFVQPANSADPKSGWSVKETVAEAYVKAKFAGTLAGLPFTGNVGARAVQAETSSHGQESVNGGAYTPVSVDNDHFELLPSLNLTLTLAEGRQLRLGLARTLARPPLDELRAGRTLYNTTPPPTGSAGNPLLKPYIANQVDLSYEWYFAPEALFAAAVYYKDVESHIGYSTQPVTIGGTTYNVTGPFNGGGGGITGAELTFQTPFSFIPALRNFGIYANFAYVDSDLKEFYPANNPLSATGLAKETATVDLWYSDGKLESRLGFKYHSPFTVITGWDGSALRTLESEKTLDFSTSYQLTSQVGLRFQASNLTDERVRLHYDNTANRLASDSRYGRRFSLDATFRY
ncbi:TonB-dependent receptor [Brevundimonas sp.]|uniref:TonB-dependent receptor n=1 Tax=Brevundimonas sp. TaxID=1871086 RepID=UPI0028A1D12F|nr:TonB-dependent receptor [Brevundimonas sp.]